MELLHFVAFIRPRPTASSAICTVIYGVGMVRYSHVSGKEFGRSNCIIARGRDGNGRNAWSNARVLVVSLGAGIQHIPVGLVGAVTNARSIAEEKYDNV